MRKYGKKLLTFLVCATMFIQGGTVTGFAATPTDAEPVNVDDLTGLEELKGLEISDEEAQVLLNEPEGQSGSYEITVQSRNWDQYGSDYIYNNYLDDAEKAFYDGMEAACRSYMSNAVDTDTYDYNGATKYHLPEVSYAGLEYADARGMIYVFLYQNPQYYFITSEFLFNKKSNTIWLTAYPEFASGEDRAFVTDKMFARVDSWVREINQEATPLAKEKKAHDITCVNTTYDDKSEFNQSAYSLIMNGRTVCAGYTKTFSMLANAAGIDTIGINGSNHGWNMSCIDGVWYDVDVTWDDSVDSYIGYYYFNRSDEVFGKKHTPYDWFKDKKPTAEADRETSYTQASVVYVDSVSMSRTELKLKKNEEQTLQAVIQPETAVDQAVIWTSSDENVATVSQTGVVTAGNVGTATITVTTNNKYKTAQCVVTVKIGESTSEPEPAPTPTPDPIPTPDPEPTPTTDATVTTSGIYLAGHTHDSIVAGLVATPSKSADLEYRWLACDTSTDAQSWFVIQDWTKNNQWLNWNPKISGDYVIVGQVRVVGNESSQAQSSVGIPHHQQIKGKCQMPYTGAGGGYLIGIESYDNPNQEYSYELLVLDCTLLAQGKDAWIWSTGRCGAPDTSFWAVWQPQYGYYWTLFRVYDKDGTMIDQECYPFVNAY